MVENLERHDLNTILYNCGKINGYSNIVDIKDLQSDIKSNININEIANKSLKSDILAILNQYRT